MTAGCATETMKMARAALLDCQQQPWRNVQPPWSGPFPVPTMMCAEELQFMYYLARNHCAGRGVAVDCGPFAGASTVALAHGLPPGTVIHSYDLWEFFPGRDNFFPGFSFSPGESILPAFLNNIRQFRNRVIPHPGDLGAQRWNGDPVEILFIDAAKTPDLMLHLVNEFFPSLLPDAFVLHQDYISAECPWIHVSTTLLSDYFEWVDSPMGGTVCARVVRPIPRNALRPDYFSSLSASAGRALIATAADACRGWPRLCVKVAEAHFLAMRGKGGDALRMWDEVKSHPDFHEPGLRYDRDLLARALGMA